jgi:hypothetical protein
MRCEFAVIASEARQSSLPALWILDCFAPLTVTEF